MSDRLADDAGNGLEQAITLEMAENIIADLEAIAVSEDDGDGILPRGVEAEHFLLEKGSVVQTGQSVMIADVADGVVFFF